MRHRQRVMERLGKTDRETRIEILEERDGAYEKK